MKRYPLGKNQKTLIGSDGENDFRHPVVLDGFSGPPLSIIKKANIVEYPEERLGRNVYVGVGRDTFLETTFQPVLVEHEQVAYETTVSGGSARYRTRFRSSYHRGDEHGRLQGTEYANYVEGLMRFYEMRNDDRVKTGRSERLSAGQTLMLFDKAMKSVGFSRDSRIRTALLDPERTCNNCGKRSRKKLLACSRRKGASYCNAQCQKEDWKKHRPNCSQVLVELQKQLSDLEVFGGLPDVSPESSTSDSLPDTGIVSELFPNGLPGSSSHSLSDVGVMSHVVAMPNRILRSGSTCDSLPSPGIIIESSGTGRMIIIWNPGSTSFIGAMKINRSDVAAGNEGGLDTERVVPFNDFSGLPPPLRFLVCCGPLPQLDIAQACVSDAIQQCYGNIGMVRATSGGFTALEWAAKKGNMEIVKWLCTDERTKPLIRIGCPIGWAGYTGKVEVMRLLVGYGADPARTDSILFGNPPLLAAGYNGQLEALKFYVNECHQDVNMLGRDGENFLESIMEEPNWHDFPEHRAAHAWATALIEGRN